MQPDNFKQAREDVERLASEYADADMDRAMNLMRRVLDDGADALLPLMLAMKKNPQDTDFVHFAGNLIKEIMNDDARGTQASTEQIKADFRAVRRALNGIVERYAAGEHEAAREIEETLAELGALSISTLENARKAALSPETARILDRIIANAKASAKEQLTYDSKLGIPRRPAPQRALTAIKELGKRIIGKN